MLVLRAEEHDICILRYRHRVARAQIDEIAALDRLLHAIRIGDCEEPLQDMTPMRRLAEVAFEPLQQGRQILPAAREKYSPAILP